MPIHCESTVRRDIVPLRRLESCVPEQVQGIADVVWIVVGKRRGHAIANQMSVDHVPEPPSRMTGQSFV